MRGSTVDADAYYRRALARRNQGDIEAAIADCRELLKRAPEDVAAHILAAELLWQDRSTLHLAVHHADVAVRLAPTSAEARLCRATLMELVGRTAAARGDYDAAIEADPRSAGAWQARAHFLHREGDLAAALKDIEEALQLNSAAADPWAVRAAIRAGLGDAAAAYADYTEYIQRLEAGVVDPLDLADAYYWRAACGQTEESTKADLQRALEVAPTEWTLCEAAEEELRALSD